MDRVEVSGPDVYKVEFGINVDPVWKVPAEGYVHTGRKIKVHSAAIDLDGGNN